MTAANHCPSAAERATSTTPTMRKTGNSSSGDDEEKKLPDNISKKGKKDRNNNNDSGMLNKEQQQLQLKQSSKKVKTMTMGIMEKTTTEEPTTSWNSTSHEKEDDEEQHDGKRSPTNDNINNNHRQEMHRSACNSKTYLQRVLPSTYVKQLLPNRFYRICCYGSYLFWFTIGVLVLRKTKSATTAMRYVKAHGPSVSLSSIENSNEFSSLLKQMDADKHPPAILMLNQHALNMTFNFLCNTAIFPGVHERFIFVTLDAKSRDVLAEYWPRIRQFHWPTPSLYKPFSFAEGAYQIIYLFRANLAVALIKRGKSFWMSQQDTFWRRNLFDIGLENESGYDLLFDQIGHGNNSKRAEWVNGANFFVHANSHTQEFFEAIAAKLAHWYTPDMGIMIHQCHTWKQPRCKFIPHQIAHSWEWMYTDQSEAPHIMQLDCETNGRSKLQQLAHFGFYFTKPDGRTCDPDAVHRAQLAMEEGKVDVGSRVRLSWGRLQFKIYWWLVDYILCTPWLGPVLKPYLPLVGYILMFTLA